jgi:hypothetical protein
MAVCLIHRYRGLAVLVRSYRLFINHAAAQCQGHKRFIAGIH